MLSDLAKKGKAYWDYPLEWLKLWDEDLTINKVLLSSSITYVLRIESEIKGFCLLVPEKEFIEIEHFWLSTKLIGQGLGGKLITYALESIKDNWTEVQVSADPNALGFYERFGFVKYSDIPSSPKGRTIPRLRLKF